MATTSTNFGNRSGSMRGIHTERITGAFRSITVHQLVMAWWLHTAGHLTRRQLRVYFAAHEMHERRRSAERAGANGQKTRPHYQVEEVARLIGSCRSSGVLADLRTDIRHLKRTGIVAVDEHTITFASTIEDLTVSDVSDFHAMFGRIPNRQRRVPVPRRTLRALARGQSRAVTGVMLAMLIRSLYWHRESSRYRVDGRTKGSWITEVFGLSRRAVTDARARLYEMKWMVPVDTPQWALNRWGARDRIDPEWAPANAEEVTPADQAADPGSANPSCETQAESASPCLNRSLPLTGNQTTRRPARQRADRTGVAINSSGEDGRRERVRQRHRARRTSRSPTLRDIKAIDLSDTERLLELHRQAVEARLVSSCEGGRLDFVALAERARRHGERPGALFTWLLKNRKTQFITQRTEDVAMARIKTHLYGQDQRRQEGEAAPWARQEAELIEQLTDDERLFQACMQVARQGRVNDPFRIARAKGWDRDRWETARMGYEHKEQQRWHVASDQPENWSEAGVALQP